MDELVAAARELANAGRSERALALLDAAVADRVGRAALDLAAAEVALAGVWFSDSGQAGKRLEVCGSEPGWQLDFLRLQYDYSQLLHTGDELRLGPWGKAPAAITGDEAGARALAIEVARWAAAIGATRLHARVAAFLAGADPLAEPEHD
ncbi:hypothetical protein Ate02nite_17550 [Paractinoplanes tereljensis]|uniref:Uncharacterized protein n=1 Tax=Paractinoplanes tereljensis TaxID=571912 RepID=A0A919TS51_9ACTN|nr:hypothetical protein Ate02nite_17550 [Actinoplanes tereljensis]